MRDGASAPGNKAVRADEPKPLLRNWIFQKALVADPELTLAAKAVAFVLLDHHNNEEGFARPGQPRIAREAGGISVATVKRAITQLKERGWFCVSPTVDPQGDPGVNRYYPIWQRAGTDGVASSGQHQRRKPRVATKPKPKSKAPAESSASTTEVAAEMVPDVAFKVGPIRLDRDEVADLHARLGPGADRLLDKLLDGEIGGDWTEENWRRRYAVEVDEWDMPF